MKSVPLDELPQLSALSKKTAELCKVDGWNIGIDSVFYRDGNDSIGKHSDAAQGEEAILAVLVAVLESSRGHEW
jgi:hypothetical protein